MLKNFVWEEQNFTRWVEIMQKGQPIYGDIDQFPVQEQDIFIQQDIQSILCVPILVGSKWWGFIGFDQCDRKKQWTDKEIDCLTSLANILGIVIEKQKYIQELVINKGIWDSVLTNIDAGVIILDEQLDNILEINHYCLAHLNCNSQEDKNLSKIFNKEEDFLKIKRLSQKKSKFSLDNIPVIGKNNNKIITQQFWIPIKFAEQIIYWVCILRDVTKIKQEELQSRQVINYLNRVLNEVGVALSKAMENRDPYTAGHQQRVAELAAIIAWKMNLSQEQAQGVYYAGLLHDIGKIYIPIEILIKPGKLTEHEFGILKSHTQVGYDILKEVEFTFPVASIVLQHHERINGSGYPFGLTGEVVSLEAKIIAVADVVEAMTSHRPYRPALGIEAALEEIKSKKGILYDARVVDTCVSLFSEGKFKFSYNK